MNNVPNRKSFQEESERIHAEMKVGRNYQDHETERFITDAAIQSVQDQEDEAFERGVQLGLVQPYPFEAEPVVPAGADPVKCARDHQMDEYRACMAHQEEFLNQPGMWEKVWSTPLPLDPNDGPPEEWGPDHPDFHPEFDPTTPVLPLGRPKMRR